MKVLITGWAGIIGSSLIRHIFGTTETSVVNVSKLTSAGNLDSLAVVRGSKNYEFEQVNICDRVASGSCVGERLGVTGCGVL